MSLDVAVEALDLILQDYDWREGEKNWFEGPGFPSLVGSLRARGIPLAVCRSLFRDLIKRGIFTRVEESEMVPDPWKVTADDHPIPIRVPTGRRVEYLITTQSLWEAFVASWRRSKMAALPPRENAEKPAGTITLSKIDQALAVLSSHPNWTNRQIAHQVGCSATYLSQSSKFSATREAIKAMGQEDLRRSRKNRGADMDAYESE
jgi:hypothetical protein